MSRYAIRICRFTVLDDLPRKDRKDAEKVLDALRASGGRFSVFDVDDALAGTLDTLKANGRLRYDQPQPAYPWCRAIVCEPAHRPNAALSRPGGGG